MFVIAITPKDVNQAYATHDCGVMANMADSGEMARGSGYTKPSSANPLKDTAS